MEHDYIHREFTDNDFSDYPEVDDDRDGGLYDEYDPQEAGLNDLYKKLTDFDPHLQKLLMEWLGMYWDTNKCKYVPNPHITPTMNIQGARYCITFLRTYARDNNILTRLGEKTYQYMMLDISNVIWLNLCCRAEEFGIHNDGDILTIGHTMISTCNLVLTGTHGSVTTADDLRGIYRRTDSGSVSGQMPMPQHNNNIGFFGRVKRFMGMRR